MPLTEQRDVGSGSGTVSSTGDIVGSAALDPETEQILEDQRTIDPELWF